MHLIRHEALTPEFNEEEKEEEEEEEEEKEEEAKKAVDRVSMCTNAIVRKVTALNRAGAAAVLLLLLDLTVLFPPPLLPQRCAQCHTVEKVRTIALFLCFSFLLCSSSSVLPFLCSRYLFFFFYLSFYLFSCFFFRLLFWCPGRPAQDGPQPQRPVWPQDGPGARLLVHGRQHQEGHHVERGHALRVPAQPQEVHPGHQDGLCRPQEGGRPQGSVVPPKEQEEKKRRKREEEENERKKERKERKKEKRKNGKEEEGARISELTKNRK